MAHIMHDYQARIEPDSMPHNVQSGIRRQVNRLMDQRFASGQELRDGLINIYPPMALRSTTGGYTDPNASLHGRRVHDVEKHLGALHQDLTRDYNRKIGRRRFIDETHEGHSVNADQIRIFEDNFIVGDDATGKGEPGVSTSIIGVTYHLSGRQNVSDPLDARTGPKALEASLRTHGDFCPAWSVCIDQYKGNQVRLYEGYDTVDVLPSLKGSP